MARKLIIILAGLSMLVCKDPVAEQVREYRAQLTGGPPQVRVEAIWMLRGLGPKAAAAIPDLIKTLQEGDPHFRGPAAMALSGVDPTGSQVIPALREALKDRQPEVRAFSARSLGNIGKPAAVATDDLKQLLDEPNFMPKQMALFALWRIHADPAHWEAILKLAESGPPPERSLAIYQLGDSGSKDPRVIQALIAAAGSPVRAVRLEGVQALGKLGPAAEPGMAVLFRAFHDEDGGIHTPATQALISLDPTGAKIVPGLIQSLSHPSARVRVQAAYALSTYSADVSAPSVAALQRTLRDFDPEVRSQAARTLGGLKAHATQAVPDLVRMLSDPNPQPAWVAAEALAELGAATPQLIAAAESGDLKVRRKAVHALAMMKSRPAAATTSLQKLIADPDPEINQMAKTALGQSGEKGK